MTFALAGCMSNAIVRFFGLLIFGSFSFAGFFPTTILAHGDEDHGEQKPKTTANAKGIVSHSTRLGDVEMMVKHPAIEPDMSTTGLLFITRFETNEPFTAVDAKVEVETSSGTVLTAQVESAGQAGTYRVTFPPMPEGVYTMRANVSYDGDTDTATFSGIEVKPVAATANGAGSRFSGMLIGIVFLVVIILLIGLMYFVWRFAAGPGASEEALSA